eukprot:503417-Hanusia_phi.AAC.1
MIRGRTIGDPTASATKEVQNSERGSDTQPHGNKLCRSRGSGHGLNLRLSEALTEAAVPQADSAADRWVGPAAAGRRRRRSEFGFAGGPGGTRVEA